MTSRVDTFVPRWASPPGDTIRDALDERHLSLDKFAVLIELPVARAERLLSGDERITIELARRISALLGGSVQFWIARDGKYREDLERVAADHWSEALPVAQMASLGWIEKPETWQQRIEVCLRFFDVPNVDSWQERYGSAIRSARLRSSGRGHLEPTAIAAWLREAEIEASHLKIAGWNQTTFESVLLSVRKLTTQRDPRLFVPKLQALCAEAGVGVVVVRAPKGCRVSGAAWTVDSTAHIALSGRYLADDHFWFTFFHEAGHLVLHDRGGTYVDEIELAASSPASTDEQEADAFAAGWLLPAEVRRVFETRRPTARDVARAARVAGVSPGVVVGQLQHLGILGFATKLNGFKRRYRWNGPTLERA